MAQPRHFLLIFVPFNNTFTEKLLTSVGFALGSLELKASSLTTALGYLDEHCPDMNKV